MTNSGGAAVLVSEFDAQAAKLVFGVPGAKVHRVFDAFVDSPTGDGVSISQRFPVRITLVDADSAHPLRKGMRATVRIDATGYGDGRSR